MNSSSKNTTFKTVKILPGILEEKLSNTLELYGRDSWEVIETGLRDEFDMPMIKVRKDKHYMLVSPGRCIYEKNNH